MGNSQILRCMQLNYYSDLTNPFQFFSYQDSKLQPFQQLSETFRRVLKEELDLNQEKQKIFKWNIGKIDKYFQQQRYCLLYRPDVGFKQTDGEVKLLSRKQFQVQWMKAYDSSDFKKDLQIKKKENLEKQQLKKNNQTKQKQTNQKASKDGKDQKESQNISKNYQNVNSKKQAESNKFYNSQKKQQQFERQLQTCKLFDFICYIAFIETFQKLSRNNYKGGQKGQEFKQNLQKFHSEYQSIMHQRNKKIVNYVQKKKIDVIFLQQISEKDVNDLEGEFQRLTKYEEEHQDSKVTVEYQVIYKDQSAIIYNKGKLNQKRDNSFQFWQGNEKFKRKLKGGEDLNVNTLMCRIGKLILISAHLSSKEKQCKREAELLLSDIESLLSDNKDKSFILGVNSNYFIEQEEFSICPNIKEAWTSNKCRSFLQAQFDKAQLVDKSVKDHIISNCEIKNAKVESIDEERELHNGLYIPNKYHPFPSYIVYGQIQISSL